MTRTLLPAFLLSLLTLATGTAAPVEIPFSFTDGFIALEVSVEGRAKPLRVLLDSGAGVSVLSLRAARRLHLPLGDANRVRGVGSEAAAYPVEPIAARSGNRTLTRFMFATDLSLADKICDAPIDGLVGIEFFQDRVVQIDYTRHRLRLDADLPAPGEAECLPLRRQNGILCAPVGVNGSTARWTRLDTGCNDALHWVVPRPARKPSRTGMSIGFVTDARDLALTTVGIGALSLPQVETALHGRPLFPDEAGLLGNGILNRFLVTIDWHGQQMFLAAPK